MRYPAEKEELAKKTFVETKDGKWVICHAGMEFDTKQEAFNFLYEEINGPDEPIKKVKIKKILRVISRG